MGLAETLRAETRDLHTLAEHAGIMPALLSGRLDRLSYCALLRNLHSIYAALEPALLRRAQHPMVAPVVFPALFREAALADDLQTLHGAGWARDFALQPAALRYLQRLHEIDADAPELLAAHVYVRSLGDLSGGQLLGRIVQRGLGLADAAGARFYAFGTAAEVRSLQQTFRAGLNALPLNADGAARIVAEARTAFERHAQLFTELAQVPALAPEGN